MKLGKKILNWLALVSLVVGLCLIFFVYFTNHSFLNYLKTLLADAEFGTALKLVMVGFGLVLLSLLLFSFSLKLGGIIRRREKEKREEEREQLAVQKERQKLMEKEAEDARAEAERLRQEVDDAKSQLKAMQTSEIQTQDEE